MTTEAKRDRGVLADITRHLAGLFRHMLPGVLLVAGAAVAYPDWFSGFDLKSWPHLAMLGVVSIAAGNTWFAVNRYGLHQVVDYFLWRRGSKGPARTAGSASYVDDLGRYARKSLHTPDTSARAREHVAFRASTVLLILTIGELSLVFGLLHAENSILEGQEIPLFIAAAAALAVAVWQMVITRRIDYYVVNPDDAA